MARRMSALLIALVLVGSATPASAAGEGDLDPSFSGDGIAKIGPLGEGAGRLWDIDVAPDGAIFTGGEREGANLDFVVVKLRPGGGLDDTFSGDGMARLDTGVEDDVNGVLALPDGRVAVIGDAEDADSAKMAIAVFRPNGKPDTSFGGDGLALIKSPDNLPYTFGYRLVRQSGGGLFAIGQSMDDPFFPTEANTFVARLKPNGTLDDSFSGDGRLVINVTGGDEGGSHAELDSSGRLVVAGWGWDGVGDDTITTVLRIKPNGTLDDSFSGNGKWSMDLLGEGADSASGLDVLDNGDILLAVSWLNGVVRLRPDGSFRESFGGGDGKATNLAPGFSVREIHERGDGKFVISGVMGGYLTTVMLRTDGELATGYGGFGIVQTPALASVVSSDLDGQDRVVAAGMDNSSDTPAVFRVKS